MSKIILTWLENHQSQQQIIEDQQITKNQGTFRIGRDPNQCDLILNHPTISGLHIEIFFAQDKQQFILRNLRDSNPPLVNQQRIYHHGEIELHQGTIIQLGEVLLTVYQVEISQNQGIKPTIISPAILSHPKITQPVNPLYQKSSSSSSVPPTYGLKCPICGHISHYEKLNFGCQWCGSSLASAESIIIVPKSH